MSEIVVRMTDEDFSAPNNKYYVFPGVYKAVVRSVEKKEGPKGPYLRWTLIVASGPEKGKELSYFTTLADGKKWGLVRLMEALGFKVPKGTFRLVFKQFLRKPLAVWVEDEEYKGQTVSRVTRVGHINDYEDMALQFAEAHGGTSGEEDDLDTADEDMDNSLDDDDLDDLGDLDEMDPDEL